MGVAGHHGMWGQPFLARLAEHFDVVAFDQRGIGDSARADAPFTLSELASDSASVLDHLGWEHAHVLGISLGGMVAQHLALDRPERVRTLVLGCTQADLTTTGPAVMTLADVAASSDQGDVDEETRKLDAARQLFAANVSRTFAAEPGRLEAFTETALSVRVPAPVVQLQLQASTAHDTVARLPDIAVPTLVLHGTEDEIILPAGGERLAALVPDARLELFDRCGHLFFWEAPDLAAEAVVRHALARR
jgi:pimeloyl-ACP methyl ester carboxylesterase